MARIGARAGDTWTPIAQEGFRKKRCGGGSCGSHGGTSGGGCGHKSGDSICGDCHSCPVSSMTELDREAVHRALAKAGKRFADLSTLELNEAFAAQVLGCLAEWPEFDPAVLNPQGGAIALGHPLGASGARLAGTVAHQLARRGSGTGVATLCIGVGQGLALVLER